MLIELRQLQSVDIDFSKYNVFDSLNQVGVCRTNRPVLIKSGEEQVEKNGGLIASGYREYRMFDVPDSTFGPKLIEALQLINVEDTVNELGQIIIAKDQFKVSQKTPLTIVARQLTLIPTYDSSVKYRCDFLLQREDCILKYKLTNFYRLSNNSIKQLEHYNSKRNKDELGPLGIVAIRVMNEIDRAIQKVLEKN